MALELISSILSPTNATYVNGVSAERRFSRAILENFFQGLVEKDGKGINDSFVSEDDATHAAQVFVNRIIPVKMEAREMGANKNGASFSANSHYTQTETVGIELLQVLDDTIIVPRARQDMIPTDLLAKQIEIYSKRLAAIVNGATAASKIMAVWKADQAGEEVNYAHFTSTDISNKEIPLRFMEANSKLDEGDQAHGIDMFPEETRIAVFKVSYRPILKASGIILIGGANYAYDIAQKAGIDKDGKATRVEDGYIGELDGVPCHILSNESLANASKFLGLPEVELKDSSFVGYLASSFACARGVSSAERTKVVDSIQGQGVILQPYTKLGVACWYPKGVVLVNSKSTAYNPVKGIYDLGITSGVTFKLKGEGSRLAPAGATWTGPASTGFTISNLAALDDWNTDHLVAVKFYVGTTQCKTVEDFFTGYTGATSKGSVTVGSAVSTTVADTEWVNVLAIADDGTIRLLAKQYNA